MSLLIRRSGILTTIQDLGRHGHMSLGINPGGAMDRTAVRLINALLGVPETAPVLEIHFPAAEIEFRTACNFVLGGADLDAHLNGSSVERWRCIRAEERAVLSFKDRKKGNRCYLAVDRELEVLKWLGSCSTDLRCGLPGSLGRRLLAGDEIPLSAMRSGVYTPDVIISRSLIPKYSRYPTIRVLKGPEFSRLSENAARELFDQQFTISPDSNRMGFRLKGQTISILDTTEMLSSGVTFGTVQLLPNGQLVVLMADHQTTGGYPRILQICSVDLPLLGQLGAGDKIHFHPLELEEAERSAVDLERDIRRLRLGVELRKALH